jgi:hypothetical protein
VSGAVVELEMADFGMKDLLLPVDLTKVGGRCGPFGDQPERKDFTGVATGAREETPIGQDVVASNGASTGMTT